MSSCTRENLDFLINPYKKIIEQNIDNDILNFGKESYLVNAIAYALKNNGKRIRPIIVHLVAEALNHNINVSSSALAIEYFHTASLVADDLPCMDDDDMRRSKPSTHKVYGETLALLVSYALIAAGYEHIAKNGQIFKNSLVPFAEEGDKRSVLALENASFNTGIFGATGGQFLDVNPPNHSIETIYDIIQKKTGSLFEISFVFGWLFGGGSLEMLPKVKTVAMHFGLAFQIADDIDDFDQDKENKATVNLACLIGKEAATELLNSEINDYLGGLKEIGLESEGLKVLGNFLRK